MSDDGQQECVRGAYCAGRTTVVEDGRHIVRAALTYTWWCSADRERIQACLEDLPNRYRELAGRIGDKGQGRGPRVSGGGKHPPLPINVGTDALLRLAGDIIHSWEERIRDVAHLTPVRTRYPSAGSVRAACGVLAVHVHDLLGLEPAAMVRTADLTRVEQLPENTAGFAHPHAGWVEYYPDLGGVDAGFEILNLHHRLLGRLGWTPQHHNLLSPCWDCDNSAALSRRDGSAGLADEVTCRYCPSKYTGERLARLMVEEEQLQRQRHERQAS